MSAPVMSRPQAGPAGRAGAGAAAAKRGKNKSVCPSYLGASVARLTRLDACGRPVMGPESVVTFEGAVEITFEPEVSEGESLDTRNMAGNLCVSASTPTVMSGINVSIEFCAWDPAALQIMNPTWKLVRNAQGVITGFRIGETFSTEYGFALEIWPSEAGGVSGLCGDDEEDGEDPNDPFALSGYFLMPWLNGRAPEEWSLTGDELATFTVNARTRGGSPWGVGPYLVARDESGAPSPLLMPIEDGTGSSGYTHPITGRPVTDPDHFHDDITTVLPPAPGCGAHPLQRPNLDVTCSGSGVTVTVTNLDEISDPDDVDSQGRRPSVWVTWGDASGRQDIANPPANEDGTPVTPGTLTHQYTIPTEHRIIVEAPNGAYRSVLADPTATLEIVPPNADSVTVGEWVQLDTVHTPGGGGEPVTVTADTEWSSSDPSIAAVGNSSRDRYGRVRGIKPGTVTITAHHGCQEVTRSITVLGPIQSIAVEGSGTVVEGQTVQLSATATRQGGDTQDITGQVEWVSTNQAVATVNNADTPGLVTGVKAGTSTIRAIYRTSSGQIAGEKQVQVTEPVTIDSIAVSGPGSVTTGSTISLTAEATMSDGSTQDVTSSATWSSSDAAIASVSGGTVTGESTGTAQITASQAGVTSGNHAVQVTEPVTIQSIAVDGPGTVAAGSTIDLTATATMSDSTTQDITSTATWSSSATNTATVDAGTVTGVAAGTAQITANQDSVTSPNHAVEVTAQQVANTGTGRKPARG